MSRLLLLDDEEMIRTLVPMMLEVYGVEAITAGTLEEAKAKLSQPGIIAVLTDILLNEESGWDFVDYVLKKRPDVRVMVVSADPDSKKKAQDMEKAGKLFAYFDKGKLNEEQLAAICKKATE